MLADGPAFLDAMTVLRPQLRGLVSKLALFYVLLTPLWLGLRGLAWLAEFKARRGSGS